MPVPPGSSKPIVNVVNSSRYKKKGKPWEVDIGRPNILSSKYSHKPSKFKWVIRTRSREESVSKFKEYFDAAKDNQPLKIELDRIYNILVKYNKLVLMCWCSPKQCHGDVIKEYLLKRINK